MGQRKAKQTRLKDEQADKAVAMDPQSIAQRKAEGVSQRNKAYDRAHKRQSKLEKTRDEDEAAAQTRDILHGMKPPSQHITFERRATVPEAERPVKPILKRAKSPYPMQFEKQSIGQSTKGESSEPTPEGPIVMEGGFDAGPKTVPRHDAVYDHAEP